MVDREAEAVVRGEAKMAPSRAVGAEENPVVPEAVVPKP